MEVILQEKRKEIRLTLSNAYLQIDGQRVNINNLSLQGLNLNNSFPINSTLEGKLFLGEEDLGVVFLQVLNHQGISSGCFIINHGEIKEKLEQWFDPKKIVSKLKPKSFDNYLKYEDMANKCSFWFQFNDDKKINSIEIKIYENKLNWSEDTGWKTFSSIHPDPKIDILKMNLAKKW